MPLLYLAKVNLNSNIFDVYDKKLKFDISSSLDYYSSSSKAYIYVTNSETVPVISDSTGRQYFFEMPAAGLRNSGQSPTSRR